MQIGDNESYLQSNNIKATNGTRLDLANGTLDIRSTKSQFLISGEEAPYFKMGIPLNSSDAVYSNNLFLIDDNNYYLKSADYIESTFIKVGGYNTYKQPKNPIVNISSTVAIAPDGNVYSVNGTILGKNPYKFNSIQGPNIGTEDNPIYAEQTAEQVKQTYISQLIPNLTSASATKGFKLDLNNSIINGYDLYLKGTNSSTNKTFLLDSTAPEIPLSIGSNFKVSWDGTLTCNDINSLNNDGRDNYAISISENFYITKSGSAGGRGVSFSGGFWGNGNFTALTLNGNSLVCSNVGDYATGLITGSITGAPAVSTGSVDLVTNVSGNYLYFKSTPVTINGTTIYSTQISKTYQPGFTEFNPIKSINKSRISLKKESKNLVTWEKKKT